MDFQNRIAEMIHTVELPEFNPPYIQPPGRTYWVPSIPNSTHVSWDFYFKYLPALDPYLRQDIRGCIQRLRDTEASEETKAKIEKGLLARYVKAIGNDWGVPIEDLYWAMGETDDFHTLYSLIYEPSATATFRQACYEKILTLPDYCKTRMERMPEILDTWHEYAYYMERFRKRRFPEYESLFFD